MTGQPEWVETLKHDWRAAALSKRERAMLEHAERLTRAPASVMPEHLDALRAVGFDDVAIFQITGIAAFFAYVNRIADGLGLARGDAP
ncbi:hypothetical protein L6R49_16290 [Myxococcota bacterium]|nr:hypothetical protein [Myxococcota bacterium]